MKLFKKTLSILIVLILAFGGVLPAFAESSQTVSVKAEFDKTSVRAGEKLTLVFSFDEAVSDVSSFAFYVGYDESLFTYDMEASEMPAEYFANCNQNPYTVSYTEQAPEGGIAKFGFMHTSTAAAAFDGTDDFAAGVFYRMVFTAKSDIQEEAQALFDVNKRGTAMLTYDLQDGNLVSITDEPTFTVNGKDAGTGDEHSVPVSPVYGVQTAAVTAELDKTSIQAGDSVTLSFSFANALQDVSSFAFYVGYDDELFTLDKEASGMPDEYYANCSQSSNVSYQEDTPAEGVARFGFMHKSVAQEVFDGNDDYAAGTFYKLVFTAKSDISEVKTGSFDLNASGSELLTYTLTESGVTKYDNVAVLTVNGAEAGSGGEANQKSVEVAPVYGVQAAAVTAVLDKESVQAGESVTLSLSLENAVQDVSSFTFYVEYDEELFTFDKEASKMPDDYYANCNQASYVAYREDSPAEGVAKFGFLHTSYTAEAFVGADDFAAGTFYTMVFTAKSDIEETKAGDFGLNANGTEMLTYTIHGGSVTKYDNVAELTVNGAAAGTGGEANAKTVEVTVPQQQDITVILPTDEYTLPAGTGYTVSGNVVTVTGSVPCRIGYLNAEGNYVAIEAVAAAGQENAYTFTAPEGVTEVVIAVKGDSNLDGKVTNADSTKIKAFVKGTTDLSKLQQFAGDSNGDGKITNADSTKIKAYVKGIGNIDWDLP